MKEQRARVAKRIKELSGIESKKYTAMDLRGERPMLRRVQRKEQARYYKEVMAQKAHLGIKLKQIDDYIGKQTRDSPKPIIDIPTIPKLTPTRLGRFKKRRGRR